VDAVILAGGLGTRLYPLTLKAPKPLLPFLDRPIVEYQLDIAREAGCSKVIVASGHMAGQLAAYSQHAGMQYQCIEETSALGTGGALANAIRQGKLSGSLLVLNGDVLCDIALRSLVATAARMRAPITLTGAPVEDASEFGSMKVDKAGRLDSFNEKNTGKPEAGKVTINAGIYLFQDDAVRNLAQREGAFSLECDYFPHEAAGGRIGVHNHLGFWRDVGTLERFFKTHFDVLGYFLMMGAANLGSTRDDYSLFRDFIYIHRNAQLGPSCNLYHRVVLMHGVTVGAECMLRNCVVMPGARIGKGCKLETALIGPGVSIADGTEISFRVLCDERSEQFNG
jgi:mannose-1-phosphate guanylyltransferase